MQQSVWRRSGGSGLSWKAFLLAWDVMDDVKRCDLGISGCNSSSPVLTHNFLSWMLKAIYIWSSIYHMFSHHSLHLYSVLAPQDQVIEVPVVYLRMLDQELTPHHLPYKDVSLSSSSQRRSSMQSIVQSPIHIWDAQMEVEHGDSLASLQKNVLDTNKNIEEIHASNSPLSSEFCINLKEKEERKKCTWKMFDLNGSLNDTDFQMIKDFVANHPLDYEKKSDENTPKEVFQDDKETTIIKSKAKKSKIVCLSTIVGENQGPTTKKTMLIKIRATKKTMLTKERVLEDITRKQAYNGDEGASKETVEVKILSKRAMKVCARYKEDINIQAQLLKKSAKKAIALKLMGEQNVDFMYKNLDNFVKNIQKSNTKDSFDFNKESEKKNPLDILMFWAFENNKVKIKEGSNQDIGQDEVEIL